MKLEARNRKIYPSSPLPQWIPETKEKIACKVICDLTPKLREEVMYLPGLALIGAVFF